MAELIGASAKEIVFTSGATESNNLAIKGTYPINNIESIGAAEFYKDKKKHIITT